MLSRNFRLQKVGDGRWLERNYDFSRIAFSIDELMVLDVSREERNIDAFCQQLKSITKGCFAPIAAGGGVRSVEDARGLLRAGADKVVINTPLFGQSSLVSELATEFGQQCVVASIDVKASPQNGYQIWAGNGTRCVEGSLRAWLESMSQCPVGELYLNSMDRDGTGQGYDMQVLDHLPKSMPIPVIMAGGAGNHHHLAEGLSDRRVDAVATAHLFNFVGDGLKVARSRLFEQGFDLARWKDASPEGIGGG